MSFLKFSIKTFSAENLQIASQWHIFDVYSNKVGYCLRIFSSQGSTNLGELLWHKDTEKAKIKSTKEKERLRGRENKRRKGERGKLRKEKREKAFLVSFVKMVWSLLAMCTGSWHENGSTILKEKAKISKRAPKKTQN